jgi:hypothetical protein
MRRVLTLLASLMLVVTAWSGAAQAAGSGCAEVTEQMTVHVAGDCDEVPADADKNYPHCHTSCHGHHVAAPMPTRAVGRFAGMTRIYASAVESTLTAYQVARMLRPPQA